MSAGQDAPPSDESFADQLLLVDAAQAIERLVAEVNRLRADNKCFRDMLDVVMAINTLTDEQLADLQATCRRVVTYRDAKCVSASVEALRAAPKEAPLAPISERIAQIIAHRACCGSEHDPPNGKFHGFCIVCGVPWPCEYAGPPPKESAK